MKVLDKGFIECEEIFGDELTIVNTARVSFGKKKNELDSSDEKLIQYLIRHQHFSPFRHVFFRFHIKAPEFVMRQWYKHVVGCEWTSSHPSQLHGWNEISGRYVEYFEFYKPDVWRLQSKDKKQGSHGQLEDKIGIAVCNELYDETINVMMKNYKQLIDMNISKEMARILLPLNVYTEVIWTTSLQALIHFTKLRDEEHAQWEIREYAKRINEILSDRFPITMKYWNNDLNE